MNCDQSKSTASWPMGTFTRYFSRGIRLDVLQRQILQHIHIPAPQQAIGLRLLGVSSQPLFLVESLRSFAASIAEFLGEYLKSKASYRYDTHHVMDVMLLFVTVCSLQISKNTYPNITIPYLSSG